MWDYVCTVCGRATPSYEKCRWCQEPVPDRRCCNTCTNAKNIDYATTERLSCEVKGQTQIDDLCEKYISIYRRG